MTGIQPSDVVGFLRAEYRACVVEDIGINWRCPRWIAEASCSTGVEPSRALCAVCPVKAECLLTAMVLDDAAPIRGGLNRQERAAAFVAAEQDAFRLDDWLRARAAELRQV